MSELYHDNIYHTTCDTIEASTQTVCDEIFKIKKLSSEAIEPFRASIDDAGYSLVYSRPEVIKIPSCCGRVVIPIDISISLPAGYCGQIVSLPELSNNFGIEAGNHIISRNSEIYVTLFNHNLLQFNITQGMTIAQLVIQKIL